MTKSTLETSRIVVDTSENEPIQVLHVDDDSNFLKCAKECLEMQGKFEVETARSVDEAMRKMKEKNYSVIISDYKMPETNGLDFLRELREKGNMIPFIMFTGKGREEVAIRALNLGANRYLDKVGETETVYTELAHSITELVKARKAEEKRLESEDKFRNLFEKANDGFVFVDLSGIIVDINEKAAEIAEKRKEDIVGKSFLDLGLISSKNLSALLEKLRRQPTSRSAERSESTERFEFEIENEIGQKKFIEVSSAFIQRDNTLTGYLAIVRDITERKKAEEEINKLASSPDENPDPVFRVARDGALLYCNVAGRPLLSLMACETGELMPADWHRMVGEVLDSGAKKEVEKSYGEQTFVFTLAPIPDAGYVTIYGRDITESKKAEESLKESKAKYRLLVEQSLQGIIVAMGPEPRGVFVNEAMTHIFGYTAEEFYSFSPKQIAEMIHPEDRDKFFRHFKERLEGKDAPLYYEVRGVRKNSDIVWLGVSSRQIIYQGQKAVQAIFSDITEHKKTDQELHRFSSAVKASLDGIITGDLNGNIADANEAALRMYGCDNKRDLIGKNVQDLLVERDRTRALQNAIDIIQTRQGKTVEYTALTKNGVEVPIEVTTQLLVDEKGESTGFVDIVRDLSERKNQHRLLEESQQKFAGLFRGNPEATVYVDPDMRILDVNPRFKILFGYSLEDVKGKHINDVVVPENLLEEGRMLDEKAAEGYVYHDTLRKRKDGSLIPVSVSAAPIIVHDKLIGYVWLYKDISQQKTVEESLKESEERFKALFAGGPEPSVFLDRDFHILDVNSRFEQLFGYSLAEIKGKLLDDVVVQEDKKEEAAILNEKAMEGYVYHDTVRRRKDGSLVPVSISASPIVIKGQLSGTVGMYKDISDLKSAEEKLAVMNEKLSVVGSLTRHDVRNKLSVVTGNTYLLRKRLSTDPKALEYSEGIEAAVAQVIKIFEFARTYERLGVEQLAYVHVRKIFDEAVSLCSDLKGIEITNGCGGLTVLADSLLRQIFYNLIDNSLKYGERTRRIRVQYKESENHLELIYEDDGVGIPDDVQGNLFKEGAGKGTGYGLFMIKRICEVYGWSIQETGEQGKGVQFIMTIPNRSREGKTLYKIQE
jgi:PAS domain S-box-containing protein